MSAIEPDPNPFAPPPINSDAGRGEPSHDFAFQQAWGTLRAIQVGSALVVAGGVAFVAVLTAFTILDVSRMSVWHVEDLLESVVPLACSVFLALPGYWLLRWHWSLSRAIRGGRLSDLVRAFEAQKSFWKTGAILVYVALGTGMVALFLAT